MCMSIIPIHGVLQGGLLLFVEQAVGRFQALQSSPKVIPGFGVIGVVIWHMRGLRTPYS